VQIPGSTDYSDNDEIEGPGGVIIACENFIIYKKID
jgi:hypothetical protein